MRSLVIFFFLANFKKCLGSLEIRKSSIYIAQHEVNILNF